MIEYGRLDAPRGADTKARGRYYERVVTPLMRKHGLEPERYTVDILTDDDGRPRLGAELRRNQPPRPIPRPPPSSDLLTLRVWTAATWPK